jgi:hypothetical protein
MVLEGSVHVTWSQALCGQNILVAGAGVCSGVASPWRIGSRAWDREGPETRYPRGYIPGVLLPPARPLLLKVPPLPKTAPPVGDQVYNTWACGAHVFKLQQHPNRDISLQFLSIHEIHGRNADFVDWPFWTSRNGLALSEFFQRIKVN